MGIKVLHDLVRRNTKIFPDLRIIVLVAAIPCSVYMAYDSFYYSRTSRSAFPQQSRFTPPPQIWTPLNALLYNLNSSNLTAHGIHPRWLHVVVNFPLLFGLPLVGFLLYRLVDFLSSSRQSEETYKFINAIDIAAAIGSTKTESKMNISRNRKYLDRTGEFEQQTKDLILLH